MDALSLHTVIEILKAFGPFGVVVIMWWYDMKQIRKILRCYEKDMAEMRQMYKNNVHLVESYESLAGDLKDVIVMNTQAVTGLAKDIEDNQYCPMVRLEKRAEGAVT